MNTGAGKYLRHGIAVLVAAIFTWLADKLPFLNTVITPEFVEGATQWVMSMVTLAGVAIWGALYAWLEKFLKRFPALDPEGAADRLAIQEEARTRGLTR